jgi:hypothetical protein
VLLWLSGLDLVEKSWCGFGLGSMLTCQFTMDLQATRWSPLLGAYRHYKWASACVCLLFSLLWGQSLSETSIHLPIDCAVLIKPSQWRGPWLWWWRYQNTWNQILLQLLPTPVTVASPSPRTRQSFSGFCSSLKWIHGHDQVLCTLSPVCGVLELAIPTHILIALRRPAVLIVCDPGLSQACWTTDPLFKSTVLQSGSTGAS